MVCRTRHNDHLRELATTAKQCVSVPPGPCLTVGACHGYRIPSTRIRMAAVICIVKNRSRLTTKLIEVVESIAMVALRHNNAVLVHSISGYGHERCSRYCLQGTVHRTEDLMESSTGVYGSSNCKYFLSFTYVPRAR
jgi:hypothetical protein